jgi:hypothetical protein
MNGVLCYSKNLGYEIGVNHLKSTQQNNLMIELKKQKFIVINHVSNLLLEIKYTNIKYANTRILP